VPFLGSCPLGYDKGEQNGAGQGGKEAKGPTKPKAPNRYGTGSLALAEQQRRDQEAREHEKEVDTDGRTLIEECEMRPQHGEDCEGAQAVKAAPPRSPLHLRPFRAVCTIQ
jgi:hypothetical protein